MSGHHKAFEGVVAGVIVMNTGFVIASLVDLVDERWLEHIEQACWVFFVVELLMRLRMHGWRFFTQPWCLADTAIIAVAALPMLGVDVTLLRVARLARLVHLGRHITTLRLVRLLVRRSA